MRIDEGEPEEMETQGYGGIHDKEQSEVDSWYEKDQRSIEQIAMQQYPGVSNPDQAVIQLCKDRGYLLPSVLQHHVSSSDAEVLDPDRMDYRATGSANYYSLDREERQNEPTDNVPVTQRHLSVLDSKSMKEVPTRKRRNGAVSLFIFTD